MVSWRQLFISFKVLKEGDTRSTLMPHHKIKTHHHDHHQAIMIINDSSSLSSSCNANTSSVSTRTPPPANMFVGLALAYIVIDIIIIFVIINLRNITFPFFVKWSLLVWFETSQSDCESLWHLGRGLASKWNDTNRIPPCYHCITSPCLPSQSCRTLQPQPVPATRYW